ncbi:uncharacterized protein LOC142747971 [Rhinoderma darwinii]|uniref:uncharacterized protein LOC142747971 n=1 Tax=Rhinoderma darwinii TaxID=43563 RepID=UPI003F666A8F
MSEVCMLEQLRAAAAFHGPGWLEETVAELSRMPEAGSSQGDVGGTASSRQERTWRMANWTIFSESRPVVGEVLAVSREAVAVSVQTEAQKDGDRIRLDDRARGEVYVCFEGPLKAHLKQEWEEWVRNLGNVSTDQDRLVALLYWLGDAWEAGFSLAKVNRFVSALAFGFKLRGFRDVSKEFLVGQALKGLRRGRVESDGRRPVSFALLASLGLSLGSVCRSSSEMELFQLAFSLAFFGALRIGELVSPSTKRAGGLRLEEVGLYGDRLELWLRRSKTDQMGKGKRIVLFSLPGSAMCPVACMRAFKPRVGSPELPLLRHENGSFLSRYQFGAVFKKCLAAVGVAAGPYSSHSFRIGAATEAGRWGLDNEGVRRIGRWESNRFRSYVRPHLL